MTHGNWKQSTTLGVLMAGRSYDFSSFTRGQVAALCDAIAELDAAAEAGVVAIPIDIDLTDEYGPDDDEDALCSAFIGIPIASGGTDEPHPVSREVMVRALAKAQALAPELWAKIDEAYAAFGGQYPGEDIAVRLGCVGPLPMAYLAFGRLAPTDAALPGELVRGQHMDQRPHELGVFGISVDACSYDGSPAEPIDVGDEAHADRLAQVPDGEYYLIARFD